MTLITTGVTMPERGPSAFDHSKESRDERGFTGLHDTNLFDQDESRAGDKIDLSTGERYDNSSSLPYELEAAGISIVDTNDDHHPDDWSDVLPQEDVILDPETTMALMRWSEVYREALETDDDKPLY